MERKQANRVQTSLINGLEKKALIWLAERQPSWVTSDALSIIGLIGAITIAVGYMLTAISPAFLWLASLGFVINWYGDSLDGTLARVRKAQRPIYGYYLDHTLDCINELIIFVGIGLSPLMHLNIALLLMIGYLLITINVSINAHLKGEFKLTYFKLGPTEFRIIAIIANIVLLCSHSIRESLSQVNIFGHSLMLSTLDIIGLSIVVILFMIYFVEAFKDAKGYAKIDPRK